MWWSKFHTVDDVPASMFKTEACLYGFVERVIDGDTIRIQHCPAFLWTRRRPTPLQTRGISHLTLSIRFYGIDTPEISKRKSEKSQPYAEEAKQFVTKKLLHRVVKVTLLRRDQYRRAVCRVETVPRWWYSWVPVIGQGKDISLELARRGLAELYTSGGAVYGDQRERMEELIARAKRQKKGIWSLGNDRISAAEHKRRAKQSNSTPTVPRGGQVEEEATEEPLKNRRKDGIGGALFETVLNGLDFVAM